MHQIVKMFAHEIRMRANALVNPKQKLVDHLNATQSIMEMRERAYKSLPRTIFDFVEGGADDEVTRKRNLDAFDSWSIMPRYLVDVSKVNTETMVLGKPISMPIIGAPTGLCGLIHNDGEVGLSRALNDAGSIYTLAAMSSYTIEEVRAANPAGRLWFQTYLWRDRSVIADLVQRAAGANYEALVVTIDVPRSSDRRRDRLNRFGIPPGLSGRTVLDGIRHWRWTRDLLFDPRIAAANVALKEDRAEAIKVAAYVDSQFNPAATWDDLVWLREQWDGPLIVKGLLDWRDARQAVDLGAQAVVVSNHGGRQFDHAPAALGALPAVVDAVGDEAEVYMDGGVRRGTDVVKAVALGARACLVGRPMIYGLGFAGIRGAQTSVRILRDQLQAALMLAGIEDIPSISSEILHSVGQNASQHGCI